jgi:hypothetical protein
VSAATLADGPLAAAFKNCKYLTKNERKKEKDDADCVFGACRSPVPGHAGHGFRSMPVGSPGHAGQGFDAG